MEQPPQQRVTDEWTFVRSKKKALPKKHRPNNLHLYDCRQQQQITGNNIDKNDSDKNNRVIQDRSVKKETTIQQQPSIDNDDHDDHGQNSKEVTADRVGELTRRIHACMDTLSEKDTYFQEFELALHRATTSSSPLLPKDVIQEIVCYGIGTFSSCFPTKYNASMLQLACVLLLRQSLATKYPYPAFQSSVLTSSSKTTTAMEESFNETLLYSYYWKQQEIIPILYYEPILNSLERHLLTTVFAVQLIPFNERGKRRITKHTLFYMPHCPMRLYSNILWANWDTLSSLLRPPPVRNAQTTKPDTGKEERMPPKNDDPTSGDDGANFFIVFGNSFLAHDSRTIRAQDRMEDTNAILRVLPFIREESVSPFSNNKRTTDEETLFCLERAFNDCVITYFPKDDTRMRRDTVLPERPNEYIMNDSSTYNELI